MIQNANANSLHNTNTQKMCRLASLLKNKNWIEVCSFHFKKVGIIDFTLVNQYFLCDKDSIVLLESIHLEQIFLAVST